MIRSLIAAAFAVFTPLAAHAVPVEWVFNGRVNAAFTYDADTNEIVGLGLSNDYQLNTVDPNQPPRLIPEPIGPPVFAFSLQNTETFDDGTYLTSARVDFLLLPLTNEGGTTDASIALTVMSETNFDFARCSSLDPLSSLSQTFCGASFDPNYFFFEYQGRATLIGTPVPPMAAVPLPTGLPLILTALGGLALWRRRKAA